MYFRIAQVNLTAVWLLLEREDKQNNEIIQLFYDAILEQSALYHHK